MSEMNRSMTRKFPTRRTLNLFFTAFLIILSLVFMCMLVVQQQNCTVVYQSKDDETQRATPEDSFEEDIREEDASLHVKKAFRIRPSSKTHEHDGNIEEERPPEVIVGANRGGDIDESTDFEPEPYKGTSGIFFSPEELVANISKIKFTDDIYDFIHPEEYLKEYERFFRVMPNVVGNDLNHKFPIDGADICRGRPAPFLLLMTPSQVAHESMRNAIRETWIKAAETNSWPIAGIQVPIRHFFLFGHKSASPTDDFETLKKESDEFGDIVMADFFDSYRNLSRKVLVGMKWSLKYCPGAKFVLKVDEDTIINVPLMVELLKRVSADPDVKSFVIGLKHLYAKPQVVRYGRWAVSEEEYPLDYYPHYLYGHTYAISASGVRDIVRVADYVKLIAPEDAFITGILPKFAGVSRLTAASFTVCCRNIFDCEVVWNQRVALTSLNLTSLQTVWASIGSHTCNITSPLFAWKRKT